eukprot:scaffold84452_cov33-Phaeocystis_antarctica.AAC.2
MASARACALSGAASAFSAALSSCRPRSSSLTCRGAGAILCHLARSQPMQASLINTHTCIYTLLLGLERRVLGLYRGDAMA